MPTGELKVILKLMQYSYVLYDGLCLLCGKARKVISVLDWFTVIKTVDAYDKESLAQIPVEISDINTLLSEIHLLDKNGITYTGFYAVRKIGLKLPLTAPFALLLYLPGINLLGEKVYAYIAKNRRRI